MSAAAASSIDLDLAPYIPMVYALVRKYSRHGREKGLNVDDLVSEGMLALVEARRHFDVLRGTKFSTYAYVWIEGLMKAFVTRHHPWYGLPEDQDGRLVVEPESRPEPSMENSENSEIVSRLLYCLPPRYQDVLCRHFGIGHTPKSLAEVAAELGLTRERVHLIIAKAMKRLRWEARRRGYSTPQLVAAASES